MNNPILWGNYGGIDTVQSGNMSRIECQAVGGATTKVSRNAKCIAAWSAMTDADALIDIAFAFR